MTNQNQFQNFLKTLADSGKVGWVLSRKVRLFDYSDFMFPGPKTKAWLQAFFLKLADTLVPAGENPEWMKWFTRFNLTKLIIDVRPYEAKRSVMIDTLPQTHRLAVKVQIITAFVLKPLEEAVDECINILSKFL
jgi:hypothetical protein